MVRYFKSHMMKAHELNFYFRIFRTKGPKHLQPFHVEKVLGIFQAALLHVSVQ